MSTLSESAWQAAAAGVIESFDYPRAGNRTLSEAPNGQWTPPSIAVTPDDPTATEQAAEKERLAREEGIREGELRARTAFQESLAAERQAITDAVQEFAEERAVYYDKVEGEVVQFALAMVRKVLDREAQVDPILLAGVVQAALQRFESGTRVLLRVHPSQAAEWREFFTRRPDARVAPEVLEDGAVSRDHCVLQTQMGFSELSIEGRLQEIERGIFDVLAQQQPAAAQVLQ
ncbi:MAG TPA: FliH/SctL family protein [Clostridia bacterium]|nr:FliH/SctL family protein [Clostridia bacterium]